MTDDGRGEDNQIFISLDNKVTGPLTADKVIHLSVYLCPYYLSPGLGRVESTRQCRTTAQCAADVPGSRYHAFPLRREYNVLEAVVRSGSAIAKMTLDRLYW